jgi:large subunit ribosomal protein L25
MMLILNAENRNTELKPKQLRRKGFTPGVLYGKDLETPLSIQFSQAEAVRFLRTNAAGSRAELVIGGKKYPALLREISYVPVSGELEHLSFQTLLAGEVVTSVARIVLTNRDMLVGVINQPQAEISYRALPKYLVERIEIDLDGMKAGDSVQISDLDIAKNPDIEILDALDSVVLSIGEAQQRVAEDEAAQEETDGGAE